LPVTHDLAFVYLASLLLAALIALASAVGITWGAGGLYAGSSSVLVSRGGDAANLLLVVPILLGSRWLAGRGSLLGLLLWPGALFYALYAYVPYLVSAPFTALLFVDVALVTLSAFSLVGLVASIDGAKVRARLAGTPARGVGGALVLIALLAYAGLIVEALGALASGAGEAGLRGHWVADWAVGTPVLLLGGVLLWRRAPLGYVAAAGLLLVSGLGGAVFAVAAGLDNLLAGPRTEPAVMAVHLAISAVSVALLAVFLRSARPSSGASSSRLPSPGLRATGRRSASAR
jgi:hypothetical protein